MDAADETVGRVIYQIRVKGILDQRWSAWFSEMNIEIESEDPPVTRLTGPLFDQAKLRGIITRLWDLNLTVISVASTTEGNQAAFPTEE